MQNIKYPLVKSEYDRVWRKYCGFLDLSIQQFMTIQESLLLQQIEQAARCPLGEKLIGRRIPTSVDEFRRLVPLTTYEDYLERKGSGSELAQRRPPRINASDDVIRELVSLGNRMTAHVG